MDNVKKARFIRLNEVLHRTGLSERTLYRQMSQNIFPKSINLGGNNVGWLEHEIDEWINEKVEQSKENNHV